jgi:nicotinamidase-related amidase
VTALLAQALVVVDVQRAFVSGPDAVPDHERLMRATERLLDQARAGGALVVFLQNDGPAGAPDQPGTEGWALAPAVRPGETVLRKAEDDGFEGTDLEALLRAGGVEAIAVCGVLSEMCVAATARAAMDRGFQVLLPHDAHATYDVPPGPGDSPGVPARMAARAAEWSLGDEVVIVDAASGIGFGAARAS